MLQACRLRGASRRLFACSTHLAQQPASPRTASRRLSASGAHPALAQPSPTTHPHLMALGEVTPGVSRDEYVHRRQQLAAALEPGSMALFPASPLSHMTHDVHYPHYQDSDFYYLCGLQEHSSLLACVRPASGSSEARWHLFLRPSCPSEELWDGPRAGVEEAQRYFLSEGAAHTIGDAARLLETELSGGGVRQLYYAPKLNPAMDARLRPMLLRAAEAHRLGTLSPNRLVHSLRVRKSDAEIGLMRRSAQLCAEAMVDTMVGSTRATTAGHTEAVLAAQFEFEIRVRGAERLAYPCVVAGGANAVTLHYMHNNALLDGSELLLMDAGASLHGYCSDLTRTWPLGGAYSAAQRDVYEAVLGVNERVIQACVADGRSSLQSLHRLSLQWTFEALVELGVLRRDDPHAAARTQRYYPHAIGHWLGLEVHDTPSIDMGQTLEPGMVVTVEPGLYLPTDDESLPSWARGIGVRIEDDVLIAAGGGAAEVLTAAAPKRVADIESLLRGGA